ncbi:MAG: P-II family nitrogen regulator [Candidatus Methanomethylophilaceae archaeon]|nr:P-II family nitrogen regulator [Candidatus Methanomethylophilaceae archaeon]
MKMIVAIVRPEKAQDVKDAIHEAGFNGMTITHVTGRGRQAGLKFANRYGEFVVDEIEKTKFEIVVDDKDVKAVIDSVCKTATTGNHGDGKIFVLPVEETYTISDFGKLGPEGSDDKAPEEDPASP